MDLFERIKLVAKTKGSVKKLAFELNIPQTTFNGYLSEKRQDNLWPLLPKILVLYPELSRDWLYFGEGQMLKADGEKTDSSYPPLSKPTAPTPAANYNSELERENVQLKILLQVKNELLEAKNELIATKNQLILAQQENKRLVESVFDDAAPTETRRDNPQHATSDRSASGATDCGV